MSPVKVNYEVVATGRIRLRWEKNSRMEEILRKQEKVIDEVYKKTWSERGGKLFNGTVFCFAGLERQGEEIEIRGNFVEYRHFIAQRKRPDLNLGIQAIGVSGIAIVRDPLSLREYAILGRRAGHLTFYPGFYECVPAGHISKDFADAMGNVDYRSQLLSEWSEETGLSPKVAKDVSGFAFVYDVTEDVYDVCCSVQIAENKEVLMKKFHSSEYESPLLLEIESLADFFASHHDRVVPTSLGLFEALRQVRNKL